MEGKGGMTNNEDPRIKLVQSVSLVFFKETKMMSSFSVKILLSSMTHDGITEWGNLKMPGFDLPITGQP